MELTALLSLFWKGCLESLYMTFVATFFAYVLGLPAGILLTVTGKDGLWEKPLLHQVFGTLINVLRSIPFLILLVYIMPTTRFLVGTSIGSTATIVPLVAAAAPYVARMVEQSLKEVPPGILEAGSSMGASRLALVTHFLLPEALPSLINGASIVCTTILSYSAMAGFVGGGGLGTIAINYGYYRYQIGVMTWTVLLLILLVQCIQAIGNYLSARFDHKH